MPQVQLGINDNAHPLRMGTGSTLLPNAQHLHDAGVEWVRLVFLYADLKFSRYQAHYDNRPITQAVDNLDQTVAEINPIADHRNYIAGVRAISPNTRFLVILNYQTLHPTGSDWRSNDWMMYANEFGRACAKIAAGLRGLDVAYEIWNEGDLDVGSSVPVPASFFGAVMVNAYKNIKQADSNAEVVFGGLVGGADHAGDYVNAVLASSAVAQFRAENVQNNLPFDAIGVHPYRKYAGANPPPWVPVEEHNQWGRLHDTLFEYEQRFPRGVPLWVTECGLAQYDEQWWPQVADYLQEFVEYFQNRADNRYPVMIWFSYADGGGETAGLVDEQGNPKQPISDRFYELSRTNSDLVTRTALTLQYPNASAELVGRFRPEAQRLLFHLSQTIVNQEIKAGTTGKVVLARPQVGKPEFFEVTIEVDTERLPHHIIYRFLGSISVVEGTKVEAGDSIGTAGEVSNQPGFTLSLERLDRGLTRLDPELFFVYPYNETELGMEFVSDLTIIDGEEFAPNIRTEKVWQLRNSGRIAWIEGSRWVQINESVPRFPNARQLLVNTDNINIPAVPAGRTYELTLQFTIPTDDGVYQARFQLETPQGVRYGQKPWLVFEVKEALRAERRVRRRRVSRNRPDDSFFSDPTPYPILMLDISHHQRNVDFTAAQVAGIHAIFHKATESDHFVDTRYSTRRRQVQDLGLLWGAYHFGRGTDAEAQVDHFLARAPIDGKTLYALDIEAGMPLDVAVAFVQIFQQKTGKQPIIYTSARAYNQSVSTSTTPITADDIELLATCPLWVAHYTGAAEPMLPTPWRDFQWALWQFTSNEDHVLAAGAPEHRIPNFTAGAHDVNRYHGTRQQLENLWREYTPRGQIVPITPRIRSISRPMDHSILATLTAPIKGLYSIGVILRNTTMFAGSTSNRIASGIGNLNQQGNQSKALFGQLLENQEVLIINDTQDTDSNPNNRVPIIFQGMRGWVSADDIVENVSKTNAWVARKQANPSHEPDPIINIRTPKEILEQDYKISLDDVVSPVWGSLSEDEELMIVLSVVREIAIKIAICITNMGFPIDPMQAFRLMFTPLLCVREGSSSTFWGINDSQGHRVLLYDNAFRLNDFGFSRGDLIAHELAHCFTYRYGETNGRSINQMYDAGGRDQAGHQFQAKANDAAYASAALPAEYTADALANFWLNRIYDTPEGQARLPRVEAIMQVAVRDRLWGYGFAANFETRSGTFFSPSASNVANLPELDNLITQMRQVIQ